MSNTMTEPPPSQSMSNLQQKQAYLDRKTKEKYDPNISLDQVKQTTTKYNRLYQRVDGDRVELAKPASKAGRFDLETGAVVTEDGLKTALDDANTYHRGVKRPAEAALDSKVLVTIGDLGANRARNLRVDGHSFETNTLITKMVHKMGGSVNAALDDDAEDDGDTDLRGVADLDWNVLGRIACKYTRRAPAMDFMLGPLALVPKTRKQIKRQKTNNAVAKVVQVQEMREEDLHREENQTTSNVVAISQILEQCGQTNLFVFITNPHSFSQTVENLFYMSFLIREGKVHFEEDEHGQPLIQVVEQPTPQDYADGLTKKQLVLELDMPTWREVIDTYEIKEPLIPTRPPVHTEGNKWYA